MLSLSQRRLSGLRVNGNSPPLSPKPNYLKRNNKAKASDCNRYLKKGRPIFTEKNLNFFLVLKFRCFFVKQMSYQMLLACQFTIVTLFFFCFYVVLVSNKSTQLCNCCCDTNTRRVNVSPVKRPQDLMTVFWSLVKSLQRLIFIEFLAAFELFVGKSWFSAIRVQMFK